MRHPGRAHATEGGTWVGIGASWWTASARPSTVRTLLAVTTVVVVTGSVALVAHLPPEAMVMSVAGAFAATVALDHFDRWNAGVAHPVQDVARPVAPSLAEELAQAVARGELVLHYQPKADLHSGRITGAEALVRWNHPRLGVVAPDAFIPLAEDTGQIAEVGAWVLEQACAQLGAWEPLLPADFTMAVNVSPLQFALQRVDQLVLDALHDNRLSPGRLELELTEGHAVHERAGVVACLSRLVELGVRCSIDDFGTGFSGLSHLHQLPLTGLKIDKSFVQAIDTTTDQAPIIRAVIALAEDLSLDVVAEGVETQRQLEFLRANGCHEAQGFHLGRPVPAAEFELLLMLERVRPSAAPYDRGLAEPA